MLKLPDTYWCDRFGSEIKAKWLASNNDELIFEWLKDDPDVSLFTITVTFKNLNTFVEGSKRRVETEYTKRVLAKVKKLLCRRRNDEALLVDWLYKYEKDELSLFKRVGNRTVMSIHGFLVIDKKLSSKIWVNGSLSERLRKDIASIDTVDSFLIEPLRRGESYSWFNYVRKGKKFCNDSW